MYRVLCRILDGQGSMQDLDLLNDVAGRIAGRTICALGDAAAMPVQSFLKHYRPEFEHYIQYGRSLVEESQEKKGQEKKGVSRAA